MDDREKFGRFGGMNKLYACFAALFEAPIKQRIKYAKCDIVFILFCLNKIPPNQLLMDKRPLLSIMGLRVRTIIMLHRKSFVKLEKRQYNSQMQTIF